MNQLEIPAECLPYLRLLTNRIIDKATAEIILESADIEMIFHLQAILLLGIECTQKNSKAPTKNPVQMFWKLRSNLPGDPEDRAGEIAHLLQPQYETYLKLGMKVLSIK